MKNVLKVTAVSVVALALSACGQVPAGHRGVFVNMGAPTEQVGEGVHYYNPLTYDLVDMNTRQQKWSESTEAYTKDIQQANVKFTLTYALRPDKALYTYRHVGEEWASTLIPQVVEQSVKNVFGQSEAVKDTINNRGQVQDKIKADITRKLKARNIIVHGFELNDISFSDAFESAVEQKQIAVETANAEKNKTVAVQERANQRVIAAEADAKAMQIKTAALSGNAKLVEYEAVQKWNGVLPSQMMGNAVPFINIK